jgi:NitT/TauT family transport system substrate-binding protein
VSGSDLPEGNHMNDVSAPAHLRPVRAQRARGRRPATSVARLLLLAAMALATLVLAACGGDDEGGGGGGAAEQSGSAAGGEGKPEQADITFGVLPTADYVAVYLAQQEGYFEEEGLKVTPRAVQGGSAQVPGLVGGDLDISGVNWVGFLAAVNRGIPLRVVAEADRGTPGYTEIVAKKGSSVKEPADLLGKKVAVPATPGSCDLPLRAAMEQGDLDSAKVQFVELPIPEMPPALQRGGIDAACLPEPILGASKARGQVQTVADVFSGPFSDFPIVGYSVTNEFAEKNPNTIGALRRALDKASKLAAEDEEAVRKILPTYTQLTPEQAGQITLPAYPASSDPAQLSRVGDLMKQFGVVQKDINVPELEAAGA